MQKLAVLIALAAVVVSVAHADPALGGGRGLWRVQDARVEEDGALVFASRWMFDREAIGNTSTWRGPLFGLEMSYAPFPFVEVFGSLIGVNEFKTGPNRLFYDWQGQQFGGKLSLPFLPVLKLAGVGHWTMELDDYALQNDGFMDGLFSPGKSWRGVVSLRLADLYQTLPTLMFNYGQSLEDGGDQFAGAGIEFHSDAVDVFVEAFSEVPKDQEYRALIGEDYTPRARISPGVRVRIPYFHITGGVEIALTDEVPDYQAILGFNFVSPFPKPPPRPFGRLAGKVVDARTGLPLSGATISSPSRHFRQQRVDENGIFFLQRAPVGVVVVEASVDGYISDAVPLVIVDQGYASHTFKLNPLVPYGTVTGRIYDAYSNLPLAAEVKFVGTDIEPVISNEVTGFFRADNVPAGLVNVRIEKEGYFPEERVIEVDDGGLTRLNVGMTPLDMKGDFTGRVIDKQTGDALAATISFVEPRREPVATDPESGEFSLELPVATYEVEVKADGYLTQTSTVRIEKDETTTRVYELVHRGMVLTLRGVYFELGQAKLRTESYPALLEAANVMKENPDITVEIQGHTCNLGSAALNQRLSERRAYAVVNFLVQHAGIEPGRLTARGYGMTQPVAPNDTEEGRQLNRRVDFVIER